MLKPGGNHGEQLVCAVFSFDIVPIVHDHTKLHAVREIHTQHLQSVQIGLDLLRERRVVGSVSQWVLPRRFRPSDDVRGFGTWKNLQGADDTQEGEALQRDTRRDGTTCYKLMRHDRCWQEGFCRPHKLLRPMLWSTGQH